LIHRANNAECPTIFHFAAAYGRADAIQLLNNIDDLSPNKRNHRGKSAIHLAIERNDLDVLDAVLNDKRLKLKGCPGSEPPLVAAIRTNQPLISFYRHPNVDLNEEENGQMLLSEMVNSRNQWLFEELFVQNQLGYGVDINRIDGNRKTLLHYAAEFGSLSFVGRILRNPGFMPYIGELSGVLFVFFWLPSFCRKRWGSKRC
jgi:hypothetical protein